MWKNRDSDHRLNQVVYRDDGRYPYVGIVNQGDGAGLEIWAGMNAGGFAIMNSASFNFKGGEDTRGEGHFMRAALQSCATVDDFQALLDAESGAKLDLSANFGVIDASGGAAYFEVSPTGYKRFDATASSAAPSAYLLRTNFSVSGDANSGAGFLRLERARHLTRSIMAKGKMDCETLLRVLARDQANESIGSYPAGKPNSAPMAFTGDSICRYTTVAAVVFEGVRPGENPRLAHMWVIPGIPITGVAVPVWPAAASVPPELAAGKKAGLLVAACDRLGGALYPETEGSQSRYLNLVAFGRFRARFLSTFLSEEKKLISETRAQMARWKRNPPQPDEIGAFQEKLAKAALKTVISADVDAPSPGVKKESGKR